MNDKIKPLALSLLYFILLGLLLVTLKFLDPKLLENQSLFFENEEMSKITLDHKDRIWVGIDEEILMIENSVVHKIADISEFDWVQKIGVDKNDQVWILAGGIDFEDPYALYLLDGTEWVYQEEATVKYLAEEEFPCCLTDKDLDLNQVDREKLFFYSDFVERKPNTFGDPNGIIDRQGNVWIQKQSSGLVRFPPDFQPTSTQRFLHNFLSSGGYGITGIIFTAIYLAILITYRNRPRIVNYFVTNRQKFVKFGLGVLVFAGWIFVSWNLAYIIIDWAFDYAEFAFALLALNQIVGFWLGFVFLRSNKRHIGIGLLWASASFTIGFGFMLVYALFFGA